LTTFEKVLAAVIRNDIGCGLPAYPMKTLREKPPVDRPRFVAFGAEIHDEIFASPAQVNMPGVPHVGGPLENRVWSSRKTGRITDS
jgi:hypothetical protein